LSGETPPKERDVAVRSTWKGFLKVSLVNIPIRVYPATESAAALSFNQLHAECQTRIQQKRWCPHCEREVPNTEIVKGYEFEKGRYVVLTDEDFAKVTVESTRVINLVQFAEETGLDPMYVDKAYYLAPDGGVASEAFAVMREGMRGKIGIGKVALYGREYLVAVKPQDAGLVMYTLHHAAEIRGIEQIDDLGGVPTSVKPDELKLAKQVVEMFSGDLNLKDYRDEYRDELRRIIDAKVAGEEVVATAPVEAPTNVVDLMAALRKSLDAVSAGKKPAAKADLKKKAAAAPKAEPKRKRA
jgi:DNA end-binding protein Ku